MSTRVAEGTATHRSLHAAHRHAAWFHELDAWTEYWDVYHPETRGRYYFGDEGGEPGLLRLLLPRDGRPPAFRAWVRMAWGTAGREQFAELVRRPPIADAVLEVDDLVDRIFRAHFGDAEDPTVRDDYFAAMFAFAADTLPHAYERDAKIAADDPRKSTAGRHTLDGDLMWFAWALHTEAAHEIAGADPRRALMLAGVALGCSVDFAWRGHRRTRSCYRRDDATATHLHASARRWALDFAAARGEVHALYRIREMGDSGAAAGCSNAGSAV
jgi:hypothetical protein